MKYELWASKDLNDLKRVSPHDTFDDAIEAARGWSDQHIDECRRHINIRIKKFREERR